MLFTTSLRPSYNISICLHASLSMTTWAPIGKSCTRFFAAYFLAFTTIEEFEEIDPIPKKLSIYAF